MRNPKPFTVFQTTPGQNPKPLFTVHAYSIERRARSSPRRSRAKPSLSPSRSTEHASDPRHQHNMPAMACLSAMQKSIRRGMEREAMEFAVELMHTSQGLPLDGLQSPRSHLP